MFDILYKIKEKSEALLERFGFRIYKISRV